MQCQLTRYSKRRARPPRLSLPTSHSHARLPFVSEASFLQPSSAQKVTFAEPGPEDNPRPSGPLHRAQSDTNLYSPIRRRSFLQHGIATRSGTDTDPLRWFRKSSRSRDDLQNYRYNPAIHSPFTPPNIPPSPPRLVVDPPVLRAETPSGTEYGHIGAFKLGSLRITNGAASPAPSDVPTTNGGDEEYMSASEGRTSPQTREESGSQETVKGLTRTRSGSPLRNEDHGIEIRVSEKRTTNIVSPEPLSIDTHLPLREFSLFKFTDSPIKSRNLANGDVQDAETSPHTLKNSPSISPQLEATSKNMAVDDDLLEAEPQTPEQTPEELGFRVHNSFDSGYHGVETPLVEKMKDSEALESKQLAKSDSGYSSNVSVRSFRGNQTAVSTGKTLPKSPEPSVIPARGRRSSIPRPNEASLYSKERQSSSGPMASPTPTTRTASYVTVRPRRSAPSLPKRANSANPPPHEPPPLSFKYPSTYNFDKSSSQPSLVEPNNAPEYNVTSSTTNPNVARRWRSRSKSRTRQPPQPISTAQTAPSQLERLRIPPVPKETSRRLEQRAEGPKGYFYNPWTADPTHPDHSANDILDRVFSNEYVDLGDESPPVRRRYPVRDRSVPVLNRRSSSGFPTPTVMSRESIEHSLHPSFSDESLQLETKRYQGIGRHVTTRDDRSMYEGFSERGRPASRDTPPSPVFDRRASIQFHPSDISPNYPSARPRPQSHGSSGPRAYSMVSFQHPNLSTAVNQISPSALPRRHQKSLPPLPFGMQTQDQMHASHMALHSMIPPVTALPFPPAEECMQHIQRQTAADSWENRRSLYARRPSMDSQWHSKSARPSMEFHRVQPQTLNRHLSFDTHPQERIRDHEVFESRPEAPEWGQQRQEEENYGLGFDDIRFEQEQAYDETHGTYYYSRENKLSLFTQQDVDSYNDESAIQQPPKTVHWLSTPASNVLPQDSSAHDLEYGYDATSWNRTPPRPKPQRKGIRESHAWGMAKNAVPVLLQKVKNL